MSRPIPPSYKAKNWPTYGEALKQRGSLTIWFDLDMVCVLPPTGKRGRQPQYSDAAIQTCLTMKGLFGMALRQTAGFVESLLRLVGRDWAVPDFSTLSRRQKALAVTIPYRGSKGPLNLLIPSRDIAPQCPVGQWTAPASRPKASGTPANTMARNATYGAQSTSLARQGHAKHDPDRSVDEPTLEIRALEITGSNVGDAPMLPELLSQIPPNVEIGSVTADGAYDTRRCHDAVADRGAHAVITPRKNVRPAQAS